MTSPHQQRDHALLSASSAHRWLNCTPSPLLEAGYPDRGSEASDQGTAAHELAEHKLLKTQGTTSTPQPDSHWVDEEMEEHTTNYANFVLDHLRQARETTLAAFLSIEERLDFSHIVPDGFGTGDAIIVSNDTLTIIDLKYGKGVKVTAENNPQLSLYALGALHRYGLIYPITTVNLVIYQPRLDNIDTWTTTPEHLNEWAKTVVAPAAKQAIAGKGETTPGAWCTFCKHAPQCTAIATQYFNQLPDTTTPHQTIEPATLTDDQITTIVTMSKELKKWLTNVEDYALTQALNGRSYPGLKLVEGRSIRRYTDETAVAETLEAAGEDPWQRKLKPLTALTKELGKTRFEELVGHLITKPAGAPTLVPETDKRPAIQQPTAETVFTPIGKE